jgi:hypothetical protein
LIPRHDRLQHRLPSIGAVNIARAQGAAFQIAKLVEHEQRMIAGAVTVPDTVFALFVLGQRAVISWPILKARPEILDRRREMVEHPFGSIKQWMNQGAFLMKGLDNVRSIFFA